MVSLINDEQLPVLARKGFDVVWVGSGLDSGDDDVPASVTMT
jgi:hypothetical protein